MNIRRLVEFMTRLTEAIHAEAESTTFIADDVEFEIHGLTESKGEGEADPMRIIARCPKCKLLFSDQAFHPIRILVEGVDCIINVGQLEHDCVTVRIRYPRS